MLFLFIFSRPTTGGKSEARIASFRLSKEMTYCGLPILYELFYSSVQFVFGSVFLTTSCFSFNQFAGCIRVHPGIPMASQKPSSQHSVSSALAKHLLLCPWTCVCACHCILNCVFVMKCRNTDVARQYNMCMTSRNGWLRKYSRKIYSSAKVRTQGARVRGPASALVCTEYSNNMQR